jgi:hypothetical protein
MPPFRMTVWIWYPARLAANRRLGEAAPVTERNRRDRRRGTTDGARKVWTASPR